ncbi:c-type cytochrome [Caldimonas brevitalea]|uniref:Cytochrome C n=1 Tax=Caldimonas brevitalea TaxID=413882 RepID=A0A0G3BUM3_9BURK|nr:cytochrome c [Caldimonas brevitalea]AKJ31718.1 cytochrome C [Caldimonas brevitalea]
MTKKIRGAVSGLAAAAMTALLAAAPAQAQFAKPEDAVKYRKASFTVMAQHFGRIGAMVNGRAPFDAKAAADNAAVVEYMSKLPWAAFGEGTDTGETKARPDIWKENDKFKAAAQKMQDEVAKLNATAKGGNLDQIKASFGAAAQTCKACHDEYRNK